MRTHEQVVSKLLRRPGVRKEIDRIEREDVSAEVILTHIAEVKLTHLGKDGGKEAADVDPGAGSGDSSVGKTRRRSTGDRSADGVFAQYGSPVPA